MILTPVYEAEFLGFSYGFRPGRSQHDALDALAFGIKGRYIWWVLDADIRQFLDASSHYTSRCFEGIEQVRKQCRYLYSQAFCSSAVDVNGLELTALYTLQDGLSRDPQQLHRLEHLHVTFRRILNKARTQLIVDSDAPRCTRCDLLSRNEAIIEPAMQGGGRERKFASCLLDGHTLAVLCLLFRLKARDFPVCAQARHAIGGEGQSGSRCASLPIEDAGDHGIGVMCCQGVAASRWCRRRCGSAPDASAATGRQSRSRAHPRHRNVR